MKGLVALLPDFIKQAASNEEAALVFLTELWPRIVGQDLAAKTEPILLKNKSLTLNVPNAIWRSQLQDLAPLFVDSINRYWNLKLVERIRFRVHLVTSEPDSAKKG